MSSDNVAVYVSTALVGIQGVGSRAQQQAIVDRVQALLAGDATLDTLLDAIGHTVGTSYYIGRNVYPSTDDPRAD